MDSNYWIFNFCIFSIITCKKEIKMKRRTIYKWFSRPFFWWTRRRLFRADKGFIFIIRFKFTEESRYQTKEPSKQCNWQKLGGVSADFDPHEWSHRWAWRFFNNQFELCTYRYKNGIRYIGSEIYSVPMNVDNTAIIDYTDNNNSISMSLNKEDVEVFDGTMSPLYFKENGLHIDRDDKMRNRIVLYISDILCRK